MRLAVILVLVSSCRAATGQQDNPCAGPEDCGSCIELPECTWCADDDWQGDRCQKMSSNFKCSKLSNPASSEEKMTDIPLRFEGDNLVLIQPQSTKVKLRLYEPQSVKFSIGQSKQYPLDLYFLLDYSFSMNQTLNTVASQGEAIISVIKEITQDFKIGIGSFTEKNLAPFSSSNPEFNCPETNPNCAQPYSFKHMSSLSKTTAEQFKTDVLDATLSGNIDVPESTLDALMQVMVCDKEIGWRSNSRKIVVLATDADFHYALDGKLVGVLDPNDGLCHLNSDGVYTYSSILDYPSISHISKVAKDNAITILFLVGKPEFKDVYDAMAAIVGNAYVEVLERNAANIVELIRSKYAQITSTLKVRGDNVPSGIDVAFFTSCLSNELRESSVCKDIEIGSSVEFVAKITATSCLDAPRTLAITPIGINQTLAVEIETVCSCSCEENPSKTAELCNGKGDNVCGQCRCYKGFSGDFCDCDLKDLSPGEELQDRCKSDGNSLTCSGRGNCECGRCYCNSTPKGKVYGRLCECDDFSCVFGQNDELCSGNGECQCGTCKCDPGWSGDDCACTSKTDQCLSPYNKEIALAMGSVNAISAVVKTRKTAFLPESFVSVIRTNLSLAKSSPISLNALLSGQIPAPSLTMKSAKIFSVLSNARTKR